MDRRTFSLVLGAELLTSCKPESRPNPEEYNLEIAVSDPTHGLPRSNTKKDFFELYFETDKFDLKLFQRDDLRKLVYELNTQGIERIVVKGHADARADPEHNFGLSANRIGSVESALTELGYEGKIDTVARGEIDANQGRNPNYQKDRKVKISVLGDGSELITAGLNAFESEAYLIDASRSMNRYPVPRDRMGYLAEAYAQKTKWETILEHEFPRDSEIIVFNRDGLDFNPSLESVNVGGSTPLWISLQRVLDRRYRYDSLTVFTDGGDTTRFKDFQGIIDSAKDQGTKINFVSIGLRGESEKTMANIAFSTGGGFYNINYSK